jgi:hypothetical protein
MSGQNMADHCGDTKIVEGDESGQLSAAQNDACAPVRAFMLPAAAPNE